MNKCDICLRELSLFFEPILYNGLRKRICPKCIDTFKAVKLAYKLDENINNKTPKDRSLSAVDRKDE